MRAREHVQSALSALRLPILLIVLTVAVTLPLGSLAHHRPRHGGGGSGDGGGDGGTDPPADHAIVYAKEGKNHRTPPSLWKMNADGSNDTLILELGDTFILPPSSGWSPDQSQVVFDGSFDGVYGIHVVNADGTGRRLVTPILDFTDSVEWSPEPTLDAESKILFDEQNAPAPEGNHDLFLIRPDGTGRLALTDTPDRSEQNGTWNPLATRIAAVVAHHGDDGVWRRDVFVYDLGLVNGQVAILGETNVTDVPGSPLRDLDLGGNWCEWAKTQDVIAVAASVPGEPDDIWTIPLADPANPVNVTNTPEVTERKPTWSEDDTEIAYYGNSGRDQGVWIMNADGSNPRLVKKGGDEPDWRRAQP